MIDNECLITIFTPTYNRCEFISQLYEDLKKQTCKNFVWLVIDDGSTDKTEELFNNIVDEPFIRIKYIKKVNGGKHTAYNLACSEVNTKLMFIALDSDDHLLSNAVEKIEECWKNHESDKEIMGMVFMCESPLGKKLYTKYDTHNLNKNPSWQAAYINGWFWGEAEYIFLSDYINKFLYPEYEGEHFFNEAYTYMQINAPLVWNSESIYIRDYQQEGLTKNFLMNVYKSPLGYADYNNIKCRITNSNKIKIKATLFYDVFSVLGKREKIVTKSYNPSLSFFLLPLGVVIAIGLKIKFWGK